jgi:hypothetical protein
MRKFIYYPVKTFLIISIVCLSGCVNAGKAADCQKYWQALSKAVGIPSDIPKTSIKTKESTVKTINAMSETSHFVSTQILKTNLVKLLVI